MLYNSNMYIHSVFYYTHLIMILFLERVWFELPVCMYPMKPSVPSINISISILFPWPFPAWLWGFDIMFLIHACLSGFFWHDFPSPVNMQEREDRMSRRPQMIHFIADRILRFLKNIWRDAVQKQWGTFTVFILSLLICTHLLCDSVFRTIKKKKNNTQFSWSL